MWDLSSSSNSADDGDGADEARPRPLRPEPGWPAADDTPVNERSDSEASDPDDPAHLSFTLPDLPKREGDLRPVDPIKAFDAINLFGEPEPEPELALEPEAEIEPDPEPEPVPLHRADDEAPMFPRPVAAAPEPVEAERGADHDPPAVSEFRPPAAALEEQFIAMLGELPATISVFAPSGGIEYLQVASLDHAGRVIAYGPDEFMEPGFEFVAELRDAEGGGFDIQLTVVESFFQAGDRALLNMTVADIIERAGERETPRAPVSEVAEAQIQYSAVLPEKTRMEVRVADVSLRGIALLTDKVVAVGDTMRVDAIVRGRNIIMGVRVARIDPAAFGRYRMGCEITRIGAADRAFLGDLAASARSGSPDQRRPETIEVLSQSRAEQAPLKERLRPAD